MIKAVVRNGEKTLVLELPVNNHDLAAELYSIGIQTQANYITCGDSEDAPYTVKLIGDSPVEQAYAAAAGENDSLSTVNTFWDFYKRASYDSRKEIGAAFLASPERTIRGFADIFLRRSQETTVVNYYCPLDVTVFSFDDFGDLDENGMDAGGSYAAYYEEQIRKMIRRMDGQLEEDLAEYYDGPNSAVAKLRSVKFGTQNVNGVLYGSIRVELTKPFTPEEEGPFREWLHGQCSDGFGESLEQQAIRTDDGEMYVHFWNSFDSYFLLPDEEFDAHLAQSGDMSIV